VWPISPIKQFRVNAGLSQSGALILEQYCWNGLRGQGSQRQGIELRA
jgi:hypothetical protein